MSTKKKPRRFRIVGYVVLSGSDRPFALGIRQRDAADRALYHGVGRGGGAFTLFQTRDAARRAINATKARSTETFGTVASWAWAEGCKIVPVYGKVEDSR